MNGRNCNPDFCPLPLRRKPNGKDAAWFLLGRGRKCWATAQEAAKIEGVTPSALSHRVRAGCPHSVFVDGRRFYLRRCLGNPECLRFAEPEPAPPTPKEKAAAREKRLADKERNRAEWIERREARDRHAQRVQYRQTTMAILKTRWQKSGAPWAVWIARKRALKAAWERQEALELGRDELRFAGKPLDAPGADIEAYGLGWGEIARRMGKRLCRGRA